eukprot:scaffold7235_cov583-Prasinococcus_capsulatus_cf.AAC.5
MSRQTGWPRPRECPERPHDGPLPNLRGGRRPDSIVSGSRLPHKCTTSLQLSQSRRCDGAYAT